MTIQESLHEIFAQKDSLANLFYPLLWERHPQMRAFFTNIDMERQAILLTMALMICERHWRHAYPATEAYLQYLGTKHAVRQIPQDQYPLWRGVMLEALQRFHGPAWNEALAKEWRAAIDQAIQFMGKGYEEHYSV